MSLHDIFQPSSWPHFNNNNTNSFYTNDDVHVGEYAFSPSIFSSTENSPGNISYIETIFSHDDEYMELPFLVDDFHPSTTPSTDGGFEMDLDEFDLIFNDKDNDETSKSLENSESSFHSDQQSPASDGFHENVYMPSPLVLPFEGMEVDNELCLVHLFMAYAEAMENQELELSQVIAQHIIQKVNLLQGGTVEHALYYTFQHLNNEQSADYLIQESLKNFYPAFKAMYETLPYGRFAHLVFNSTILEALPRRVEIIHIIDFDIGEGIQWASLMDAVKNQIKEIRITSVKFSKEDGITTRPLTMRYWRFEETKRRLCDHARSCGLKIKVEEVGLHDLENEMINRKKKENYYGRKSWYVFNCIVGLPHMGRVRSTKDVLKFLRIANNFLVQAKHSCVNSSTTQGIITYCDGDAPDNNPTSSCSYSSFLNGKFVHYRALLESLEFHFPNHHLREARTALECLFLAPYVSSVVWNRKWEEKMLCGTTPTTGSDHHQIEVAGLEKLQFSEACLIEGKEMLKVGGESSSLYGVWIGEQNNEIFMQLNGIPMLRVCCWKS